MSNDETIRAEATLEDVFRIAIKREAQAHHYYREAANLVQTKEARELLLRLAREEVEHETALRRQLTAIEARSEAGRAMGGDR